MATSPTMSFDGKKCSREWFLVLSAARGAGVGFHLNQGRRTIQEQQYFYSIYRRYGRPLAAVPSQAAPHIRYGQANHAVDIGAPQVYALAAWLRRHGVKPQWTVRGEPWHIELTMSELLRLAAKFAKAEPYPNLKLGARGEAVKRLQKMLREQRVKDAPSIDGDFGPATVKAVKRFQSSRYLKSDGVVGDATWRALRR